MKTNLERTAQTEEILRLRAEGLSLRAIGERVGLSHQGVADRLSWVLAERVAVGAEEFRALESARLEALGLQAYDVLAEAEGEVRLKAIDRLLRLSESRRKLWALDMPQPLDVVLSRRMDLEGDLVADALSAALEALAVSGLDEGRQDVLRRYALALAQWRLLGGEGERPVPPAESAPVTPGGGLEADLAAFLEEEDGRDGRE
ncbi:hypothetical protein [Streptomyces iconiensis]|uniref:Homeodomain-like domain-containing protein n=1 Tax=Streptomyces iconiensis TaxID=1384038 RepID=A0ABT6ZRT6_9ACTN|nr:hypothetical protein [Streptomyces iconiensis]MDJ1131768.1 hypothetical protein [Streptomyces iconiensis]